MRGQIVIPLSPDLTLRDVDAMVAKMSEHASVMLDLQSRRLRVTWEAEDGWHLRGTVEESLGELEAYLGAVIDTAALIESVEFGT